MDWKDLALMSVTGLATISFALSSWALFAIVAMKTEVGILKSQRDGDTKENNRRFFEVDKKLGEIKEMLVDALKFQRRSDHSKS